MLLLVHLRYSQLCLPPRQERWSWRRWRPWTHLPRQSWAVERGHSFWVVSCVYVLVLWKATVSATLLQFYSDFQTEFLMIIIQYKRTNKRFKDKLIVVYSILEVLDRNWSLLHVCCLRKFLWKCDLGSEFRQVVLQKSWQKPELFVFNLDFGWVIRNLPKNLWLLSGSSKVKSWEDFTHINHKCRHTIPSFQLEHRAGRRLVAWKCQQILESSSKSLWIWSETTWKVYNITV